MSTTLIDTSDRLLRRTLTANAVFSTICGLCLIVFAAPLAALMGTVPTWLLVTVGIALFPFAIGLFVNARRKEISLSEARLVVIMDFGWVAGSIGVIALYADQLTLAGMDVILAVAAVVAVFGVLQTIGIRRLEGSTAA